MNRYRNGALSALMLAAAALSLAACSSAAVKPHSAPPPVPKKSTTTTTVAPKVNAAAVASYKTAAATVVKDQNTLMTTLTTSQGPPIKIEKAAAPYLAALERFEAVMVKGPWPSNATTSATAMQNTLHLMLLQLQKFSTVGSLTSPAGLKWAKTDIGMTHELSAEASAFQSHIGLPAANSFAINVPGL